MRTTNAAVLSLALSLFSLSASSIAATYSWNASSGLFPNQIDASMALNDASPTFDPALAGGVLTLQTAVSESMFYLQPAVSLSMPVNLEIDFTVRYVSGSTTKPGETHIGIFFDTADNVGGIVMVRLGSVTSTAPGGAVRQNATANTDDTLHDYRIAVSGTTLGSSFTVYQDSVPLLTDTLSASPALERIGFGDGATAAFGAAEWKSFSHNAAVPEPSAWAMMLGSVGMLAGCRRFGRRGTMKANTTIDRGPLLQFFASQVTTKRHITNPIRQAAAIVLTGFAFYPTSARADVTLSDSTFNSPDWSLAVFSSSNGGNSSASQQTSGGDPGSYRQVGVTVNSAPPGTKTLLADFSEFLGGSYTPSTAGAISSINYSQNTRSIVGGQANGPALIQNGRFLYLSRATIFRLSRPEQLGRSRRSLESRRIRSIFWM